MHFSMATGKPFNPIIGETFQSKSGNTEFYSEQTNHHPPRTHFYMTNPKFKYHGYTAIEVSGAPNMITGYYKGKFTLDFKDGTQYTISYPGFQLIGIMFGRRYVNFSGFFKIEDVVRNFN